MRLTLPRLAALAAAGAIGAGGGVGIYSALQGGGTTTVIREIHDVAQPAAATTAARSSVSQIYRNTSAGVVEITATVTTSSPSPYFGPGRSTAEAQGSGFVLDTQGHIVTNEHVIDGASAISVKFANGSTYKARLVGSDTSTDLAVLKVDAPASLLQPLQLADSSKVQVGDGVVAIGSPFGLENTVTAGIVSGVHRRIDAPNGFTIGDAIQTDAAINHGNSGGALLDLQGRLIGVTAQIESDSGSNAGVGFAIPSNTVRSIVSQLVSGGNVQHAYLGVGISTAATGVELTQVRAGTPAAKAGLQTGDVITALDGKAVRDAAGLGSMVDAKRPGDTVSLTYVRGGKTKTVTVKLAARPS